MKKPPVEPWIVHLCCPFCNDITVEAVDPARFPESMSEKDRFMISTAVREFTSDPCEHLAFKANLALGDCNVEDQWQDEMRLIAKQLNKRGTDPAEVIARAHSSLPKIKTIAKTALPEYEVAVTHKHIPWGECSHGPTFFMIFMKKLTP